MRVGMTRPQLVKRAWTGVVIAALGLVGMAAIWAAKVERQDAFAAFSVVIAVGAVRAVISTVLLLALRKADDGGEKKT